MPEPPRGEVWLEERNSHPELGMRPPIVLAISKRSWYIHSMTFSKAKESFKAASLCFEQGYTNSATSRAYYAMFQAAQVAHNP